MVAGILLHVLYHSGSIIKKILFMNISLPRLLPSLFQKNNHQVYHDFLKTYPAYTETMALDELRKNEFSQLDKTGHVYLDFTGGNLFPKNLLQQHMQMLENGIFGNPHSTNPASQLSTRLAEEARQYVLQYFNASDQYLCIFTPNASGALKIVGECYPFNDNSFLLLSLDNHNSVNGIREFAKQKGAAYGYTPLEKNSLYIHKEILEQNLQAHADKTNKLFTFPAQSNVSGIKHPLSYITMAKQHGWDVLLDAAAFVPSDILDLRDVQPDFVSVSFYKIFGYPTGIGCLLMRKDIFTKMVKPWYAGGTITLSSAGYDGHFLKHNEERFEDGTINYLNIPAVKTGLQYIENIGMEKIKLRIQCLAAWLIRQLVCLEHSNGQKLLQIFGATEMKRRGGTIVMNFYNSRGTVIPFWEIEAAANKKNISIRTGCFCNPGLDETNNNISTGDLQNYFGTRMQGDYFDMITATKKLRGSVRVSLGLISNFNDVHCFYQFARSFLQ
jgi:selenocysteine lyase/cysteine desulfurase